MFEKNGVPVLTKGKKYDLSSNKAQHFNILTKAAEAQAFEDT